MLFDIWFILRTYLLHLGLTVVKLKFGYGSERKVSDLPENIKAKDLKRLPGDYPPLIERKGSLNGRQVLKSLI